MSVNNF